MKFLHAADIHLDSPLRGLEQYEGAPVDEIRSATRRALDNLIDLAISEQVDFVLLAGDIYDGDWKDYNTGLYFVSRMSQLQDAGIKAFVIRGNHDAASQMTKTLRLPDNVKMFSTSKPECVVLEDLQVAIHGQGFSTRAVTDDLSQAYSQGDPDLFNIGLLHTCLDGKPGHEPYAPCTMDGLRSKGYQYWALGHVHKREVVSRDPWIVFPGNLQGRHIRETGPKGCTLVIVEDGEVSEVLPLEVDVLRWEKCEIDVSSSETPDDVFEKVRATLQQTLDTAEGRAVAARLILTGTSVVHSALHSESEHWTQEYRALATGLGGAGLWLEKMLINTEPPAAATESELASDDALNGLLQGIRDKKLNNAALSELADEVTALRQKLPSAILRGEESYDPTNPDQLATAMEDVREILMRRLLKSEQS